MDIFSTTLGVSSGSASFSGEATGDELVVEIPPTASAIQLNARSREEGAERDIVKPLELELARK